MSVASDSNRPAEVEYRESKIKRIIYSPVWAALLLASLLGGTAAVMYLPGHFREIQAKRSKEAFKRIAIALHNYHDRFHTFPPQFACDKNGKRLYSWRVILLPFLDQDDLYRRFRLDEAWSSPNNLKLLDEMPAIYALAEGANGSVGKNTAMMAPSGINTIWPGKYACGIRKIRDGTSQTAMMFAVENSKTLWTEPFDLYWDLVAERLAFERDDPVDLVPKRLPAVAYADGSIQQVPENLDKKIFYALLTAGSLWPSDFAAAADGLRKRIIPMSGGDGKRSTLDAVFLENSASAITSGRVNIFAQPFETIAKARDEAAKSEDFANATTIARNIIGLARLRDADVFAACDYGVGGHGDMPADLGGLFSRGATIPGNSRDICIWCRVRAESTFPKSFDVLKDPIAFADSKNRSRTVSTWGVDELSQFRYGLLAGQIRVLNHSTKQNFILQLTTQNGQPLILAKLQSQRNVADAIGQILNAVKNPLANQLAGFVWKDEMRVPMVGFHSESVATLKRGVWGISSMRIGDFLLNQSGAIFEIAGGEVLNQEADDSPPPPGGRKFIFDGPFWVALLDPTKTRVLYAIYIDDIAALLDWK